MVLVIVYGRVSGNVRLTGTAVVFSNEEIQHAWSDTLVLDGQIRSIIRENSRDELKPSQGQAKDVPGKEEKARKRGISR